MSEFCLPPGYSVQSYTDKVWTASKLSSTGKRQTLMTNAVTPRLWRHPEHAAAFCWLHAAQERKGA